jgi:two-component system, NtrC family, response regulator AtoC
MGGWETFENLVERLVVLSNGDKIGVDDLPFHMRGHPSGRDGLWFELPADPINLEHVEREIIRESLRRHDGNQSHTAKYLGITRSALIYRMQKYGLE